MATVSVSVKVDKRRLEALIRQSPAKARDETKRQAVALRDDVRRRMPKKTGETARKTREVQRGPYEWAVELPEVPARYLIEGTGIYGPRHRKIVPVKAKALRFGVGGSIVYARSVKGIKPHPFLDEATRAAIGRAAGGVVAMLRGLLS